jgi:serine/threonine protein phosphatase 1
MNRLFAIGDIHGCFDTMYKMITEEIKLEKSDRLILLGDYIDRGPKSREVIDFIIDLDRKGFNIVPLMGNHESMLIESYEDNNLLPLWFMNSGMTTLRSFNVDDINQMERKYIDFFTNLKFFERTGNFLFVHAGFNDYAADPLSDYHGMIWECKTSYGNPALKDFTIIHGHRPKTVEYVRRMIAGKSGVIPIDTGAVYEKELGYGILSALEINTMELTCIERTEKNVNEI